MGELTIEVCGARVTIPQPFPVVTVGQVVRPLPITIYEPSDGSVRYVGAYFEEYVHWVAMRRQIDPARPWWSTLVEAYDIIEHDPVVVALHALGHLQP